MKTRQPSGPSGSPDIRGGGVNARGERLLALDAIRLLAALAVVWTHFLVMFEWRVPRFLHRGILDSQGAVMLFFVLSGYVLSLSLRRDRFSVKSYFRFAIRRVFRLYPLYWVTLLIAFGVLVWIQREGGFVQAPELAVSFLEGEGLQLKQWALQSTLVAPGMQIDFANPPVWTLMVEAKIAIVFPFMAWLILHSRAAVVVAFLAAVMIGSPWLEERTAGTVVLLAPFGVGAVLARIPEVFWSRFNRLTWWLFMVGGIALYSSVSLRNALPSKWLVYHACTFGSAALVACGVFWKGFKSPLERMQRFLRLDVSYGLYILHFPVLLAMRKLWMVGMIPLPPIWIFSSSLVLLLCIAAGLHVLIEMPAIRMGRHLTSGDRA